MELRPLPGKVLILPDPVETTTASGLVLVEHWPMEVSGVVVAIGHAKHPRKDEAFELSYELARRTVYGDSAQRETGERAAQLLRDLTGREPEVTVGDRVLFGLSAGQEVRIEDTRYFLMHETDIAAIVAVDTESAA